MTPEEDAISVRSINGINIKIDHIDIPTLIVKGKHDPFDIDNDSKI